MKNIWIYTNHKTNISPDLYIETSVIVQKLYVSEWLLFNTNSAIFQLYQDENKLIFNEMMTKSALYYINMRNCIFIVIALRKNSTRIDMWPHSDKLSWFWVNQSLLFLLNAARLAEKQQIPISVFGLTRSGFEPTRSKRAR